MHNSIFKHTHPNSQRKKKSKYYFPGQRITTRGNIRRPWSPVKVPRIQRKNNLNSSTPTFPSSNHVGKHNDFTE